MAVNLSETIIGTGSKITFLAQIYNSSSLAGFTPVDNPNGFTGEPIISSVNPLSTSVSFNIAFPNLPLFTHFANSNTNDILPVIAGEYIGFVFILKIQSELDTTIDLNLNIIGGLEFV